MLFDIFRRFFLWKQNKQEIELKVKTNKPIYVWLIAYNERIMYIKNGLYNLNKYDNDDAYIVQ